MNHETKNLAHKKKFFQKSPAKTAYFKQYDFTKIFVVGFFFMIIERIIELSIKKQIRLIRFELSYLQQQQNFNIFLISSAYGQKNIK